LISAQVTGLIHCLLDFQTVDDDELRLHIETSVEAVEAFEKTKLFTDATERDRYLWNFHSHHEAVYPSSDSQLELFMQLFWYVRVVWPLFYLGYYYGVVPEATSRVWLVALIVGLPSQQTHFLAHARRRGLLKEWPTVWKSTSVSGGLSRFSAMTGPSWLGRAARNRHRHAIEQTSRRWRGYRRASSTPSMAWVSTRIVHAIEAHRPRHRRDDARPVKF